MEIETGTAWEAREAEARFTAAHAPCRHNVGKPIITRREELTPAAAQALLHTAMEETMPNGMGEAAYDRKCAIAVHEIVENLIARGVASQRLGKIEQLAEVVRQELDGAATADASRVVLTTGENTVDCETFTLAQLTKAYLKLVALPAAPPT